MNQHLTTRQHTMRLGPVEQKKVNYLEEEMKIKLIENNFRISLVTLPNTRRHTVSAPLRQCAS